LTLESRGFFLYNKTAVGPHLRLQYPSKEWMRIAMKQISDRVGFPLVFYLCDLGGGLGLDGFVAGPDERWRGDYGFVFRPRK